MSELAEAVSAWADRLPLAELSLPDASTDRVAKLGDQSVELRSRMWRFSGCGRVRLATLTGDRGLAIVNAALFPGPHAAAPVIQAEYIEIRGRVMLVLLDALDPHAPERVCLNRSEDPALPRVALDERPAWTRGYLSDHALWSTPGTEAARAPARVELYATLGAINEACSDPDLDFDTDSATHRTEFYARLRAAFLANEPSRPMLHRMFGEPWSESYMANVLLPPLER